MGMIVGLVLAALVVGVIVMYNGLVTTRNGIRNALGQIKVQLRRRQDLIPNLAEAVKGVMDFEQSTLTAVIQARSAAAAASSVKQIEQTESVLSQALGKLMAVVEQYPDLKSNKQVSELMETLTSTENRIAFARQAYNDSVLSLNNQVDRFPSNLIAGWFNVQREENLDIPLSSEEAPKVSLRPGK